MIILAATLVVGVTNQAVAQIYYWTTFVGRAGNTNGGDGVGTNAFFNQPTGGAMDAAGNFYTPDEYNDAIRKVTPDGTVSTFAGSLGIAGTNDGTNGTARFYQPTNLTFDKAGNMYVVDTYANTVRKITPAGVVTTLAGLGNVTGTNDGTGSAARFNQPNGIGYDAGDNVLYVADGFNGSIRKVTLAGVVTTIAGGGQTAGQLFYGVEQVAVNSSHLLLVLDAENSTVWTMNTNGGNLTVLAGPGANHTWPAGAGSANGTGSAAQFNFPESLWLDGAGNAFVADYGNDTIRKVTPAGVVTTVGGSPGVIGTANGTNSAARFNQEEGIFVDPYGNLYVADTQSSTIRIGYRGPPVIVAPPSNLVVAAGASPSFTVTAGGAAPRSAYQWRFNGVALTNNGHISGAQTNALTLSSVTTNDAGTYQVTVTNAYGPTNVSATLTVSLTNVMLSWTTPAPIVYGTALGSNQLDATANVPGGFAYTPTNGTVLGAATNTLSVIFTPTDTNDYASASTNVSLVVSHAALAVTANNASRVYGQTNPVFTGTITGVTNGDNITATYATTATTNTPVGTNAITPSLVDPGNRQTNYNLTLNDGILTITQAASVISWTNPSPIVYGTALSSNQLDATANVPGGFAYTPTNGTLVAPGTNTLSALFTPADTNDYTGAATNVSLVVQPPARPAIQSVGRTNGSVTFTWNTTPRLIYQIEFATNLSGSNWSAFGSAITATNSTLTASDAMTNLDRFYRVVILVP
jgi:hypothetical protein